MYFIKTLELYEICNHIMLSQTPSQHSEFFQRLGLPMLYQCQDQMGNISRLDACLNKWEQSLPPSLRYHDTQDSSYGSMRREALYLRSRYVTPPP